jgi:hypothetical protein
MAKIASLPQQLKAGKEYYVNYMTLDFVSNFDFSQTPVIRQGVHQMGENTFQEA